MFTGLVEEIGIVEALNRATGAVSLRIRAATVLEGTRSGDSIAVSGVCLTVTRLDARGFDVDMVPETAARTNLLDLRPGARVNLERSLKLGDRLGGHFVLGHADAVVDVVGTAGPGPGETLLRTRCPRDLTSMIAEKGSVTLDGVSLTVAAVDGDTFAVALIPYTLETTTLGGARIGARLNLEVDVLARYVARQAATRKNPEAGLTENWMRSQGYA